MRDERQRIDIGGVQLEAVVAGNGPVTVVFENGLATALEEWEAVAGAISARARRRLARWRHARPWNWRAIFGRSCACWKSGRRTSSSATAGAV